MAVSIDSVAVLVFEETTTVRIAVKNLVLRFYLQVCWDWNVHTRDL